MKTGLSAKMAKKYLEYNPSTGQFVWKESPAYNKKFMIGRRAGCKAPHGYIFIKVFGVTYYGHRLAWLFMTGRWPRFHLDHKNGRRSDNRWSNLRRGGHVVNSHNRRGKQGSRFGLKGIFFSDDVYRRKPFGAKIGVRGKTRYLGYFATPQLAHKAYCIAAKKYHGEFARAR